MSSDIKNQWPGDDDTMDVDDPPHAEPMNVDEESEVSPLNQRISEDGPKQSVATGKGVPLSDLQRTCGRWGPPPRPFVIPSPNHSVLFKLPWKAGEAPVAYPPTPCDRWDQEHVRMPHSSESLYPVQETEDEKGLRLRWELVQEALLRSISNSHQLETAILSFNSRYNERWNFRALHSLFNDVLDKEETDIFFKEVLPSMVILALQLPELVTGPIPLLRKHKSHSLTLSQIQIGSLLANAFFCTFPRRNSTKRGSEYSSYPDINFNRLFQSGDSSDSNSIVEKLKCVLNYFRRICSTETAPTGTVTFSRRYIPTGSLPDWSKSTKPLPKLHIRSSGCIEDEGAGMLQVDFANKFIGGGVLGWGCVQEEIRFVICPELIVSRLFTECLDATEALLMIGCERFNQYSGYGHSFEWVSDYTDETPLDSAGRRHCSIVAMDALCFSNSSSQYSIPNLVREVNKAYVGFCEPEDHTSNTLAPVATGNWGCGAFRGDPHLKALLQLLAAGEAGRALVYFTFGDEKLRDRIFAMYQFLIDNNVTVGKLWGLLNRFSKTFSSSSSSTTELYEFLYSSAVEDFNCQEASFVSCKQKGLTEKPKPKPTSSGASSSKTPSKSNTGRGTLKTELTPEDVDQLIEEFDSDAEDCAGTVEAKPRKRVEPAHGSSSSCLDLLEESVLKNSVSKQKSLPIDTAEAKPRKRNESVHGSSSSCLDLIEESLLKDSVSKSLSVDNQLRNRTPAKTNVHVSLAGTSSGFAEVGKLKMFGSATKSTESEQEESISNISSGKKAESKVENSLSSSSPEEKAESKREQTVLSNLQEKTDSDREEVVLSPPERKKESESEEIVVRDSQKLNVPVEEAKSDGVRSSQKSRSNAPKRKISDYFSPMS
ncbi:poly(ADP-ribose) glycohydrolase-like [Thrips palmi]|uniref:poly(ADP-ribose) glycohydrolase n=1 Tax=Thrips palmi TaxID=161013 RepID=A0A6P8ZM01_THRPL|nr:poly(ADP-ribose) glycohydrolase-like [Thrips palmi]XP_034239744.1 poly(ADP-ribose) glycohydrolase-like [Thrips palmi]XP_034239745.1 poly(ADP-ribose) glycohydrolase-like [Thrips palmi]